MTFSCGSHLVFTTPLPPPPPPPLSTTQPSEPMPSLLRPPLVLILLCLFLPLSSPRLLPESNPLPIPAHAWDFRSCDPAVTVHSPYPGQVQAQFSAQITCDSAGATLAGDESPYIELDEFLFGRFQCHWCTNSSPFVHTCPRHCLRRSHAHLPQVAPSPWRFSYATRT